MKLMAYLHVSIVSRWCVQNTCTIYCCIEFVSNSKLREDRQKYQDEASCCSWEYFDAPKKKKTVKALLQKKTLYCLIQFNEHLFHSVIAGLW